MRIAALLPLALSAAASVMPQSPAIRTGASCAWSMHGDPRVVVRDDRVFTGCITRSGAVTVEEYGLETGERSVDTIARGLEADDHNNPSLIFFRQRLFAFWSPHSGYHFPESRRFFVRYRIAFGRVRSVPLGRGCGLGYTYPDPVVSGGRLFLFMRGPCWEPYVTSSRDGVHWTRPQTLLKAPAGRKVRPYAKYASARDGSVVMAFSDGNPGAFESSLYWVRLKDGAFYAADGRRVGRLDRLPLRLGQLDRVAAYGPATGRAWPQDVADDRDGRPVIAYSSQIEGRDTLRYARWDGTRWTISDVAAAGGGIMRYTNAGIALDHQDPSTVAYAQRVEGRTEIVLATTPDGGATWVRTPLTTRSPADQIRPVFGLGASDRPVVAWFAGRYDGPRDFRTRLRMYGAAPP